MHLQQGQTFPIMYYQILLDIFQLISRKLYLSLRSVHICRLYAINVNFMPSDLSDIRPPRPSTSLVGQTLHFLGGKELPVTTCQRGIQKCDTMANVTRKEHN